MLAMVKVFHVFEITLPTLVALCSAAVARVTQWLASDHDEGVIVVTAQVETVIVYAKCFFSCHYIDLLFINQPLQLPHTIMLFLVFNHDHQPALFAFDLIEVAFIQMLE